MDELEQQIKAWADTTMAGAPADAGSPPAAAAGGLRHRGRWLAAAAVLVLVALVGTGLALRTDDDGEQVRSEEPVTTTMPAGVAFEVLGVLPTSVGRIGDLEAAQTPEALDRLWTGASTTEVRPAPDVDFARQVVVGITIPDDNCPPTLTEFIHDGGTVEPQFVEDEKGVCEQPLLGRTYVVALDWSTTGDRFQLLFSGLRPEDDETTLDVVRAGTEAAGSTTTAPLSTPEPIDVSFQLLGASNDSEAAGTLGSAQDADELRQLRLDAGVGDRADVDFATRVVLSFTVLGRDCPATLNSDPPILGGMLRTGTELEPQFLPIPDECETNDTPRTYLVSVPWAETGDEFDLVLSSNLGGEADQQLHVEREDHEPAAPSKVTASLKLDATTVVVGGTLRGTVTVDNRSGAPIEGTTCGDYFIATLRNEEYGQGVARTLCEGPFTLPEGTSTYPVSVTAVVTGCTPGEIVDSNFGLRCNPDGSMPALPPGEYQVRVDDPQELVPAIDPVTITVTPT